MVPDRTDELRWQMLARFLEGGATAGEVAAMKEWEATDAPVALLTEALQILQDEPINQEAAWARLQKRIHAGGC